MRRIETRLRSREEPWDAAMIAACLAELDKDAAEYLAEQDRLSEQFRGRMGELGEMAAVGEQIETANLAAISQLETTINNLKYMDFHGDFEAAGNRLLDEMVDLRTARHSLHNQQEAAFLAVARQQNRLDQIHSQVQTDYLTRLPNRIGIETALWQRWQQGYPEKHKTASILLDLNGVRSLTRNLGSVACDRLLVAVAGVVGQLIGPPHLVARFAEYRFLIVMVDTGPQGLQKMGELLWQSIERISFVSQGNQVAVTAHAGIAPLLPGESVEGLLGRAEQAWTWPPKARPAAPVSTTASTWNPSRRSICAPSIAKWRSDRRARLVHPSRGRLGLDLALGKWRLFAVAGGRLPAAAGGKDLPQQGGKIVVRSLGRGRDCTDTSSAGPSATAPTASRKPCP